MLAIKDSITEAVELLSSLIRTPSLSKKEEAAAKIIRDFFTKKNIPFLQKGNNTWVKNKYWTDSKPSILLNSHIDTVKAAAGWTKDPFSPLIENGRLYGLGSNDAGGPLIALLFTFLHFYEKENLNYNLVFAASAEEEISGKNGIACIVPELGKIDLGIIGEPTQMQMAIAEKGLMVIDGIAKGKAGHAARNEGINAIYIALEDIQTLKQFQFEKTSPLLGPIKISVTQIEAGTQHNVVPDNCSFVIDVRSTEMYSNEAIFNILQAQCESELKARSFRLNSSGIPLEHPIVKKGILLGRNHYGSPTLSDQALLNFPTIKIGPGDSARSHTADEYIKVLEIEEGIALYIAILNGLEI